MSWTLHLKSIWMYNYEVTKNKNKNQLSAKSVVIMPLDHEISHVWVHAITRSHFSEL